MKTINFKWCTIYKDYILVHTNDEDISYRPAFDLLIVNGIIEIEGLNATITGDKIITHLHFHKEYVKNLNYVPVKNNIRYTFFRKKPYVSGWVEDSERIKFKRTFINYKIEIYQ